MRAGAAPHTCTHAQCDVSSFCVAPVDLRSRVSASTKHLSIRVGHIHSANDRPQARAHTHARTHINTLARMLYYYSIYYSILTKRRTRARAQMAYGALTHGAARRARTSRAQSYRRARNSLKQHTSVRALALAQDVTTTAAG